MASARKNEQAQAAQAQAAAEAAKAVAAKVEDAIKGKMLGCEWEVRGEKLIITVDLTSDLGPSSSGKTLGVATTSGNKKVAGTGHEQFVWSLNVYKYMEPKGTSK